MNPNEHLKIGVVFGNRGFFPGELCIQARQEILQALTNAGIEWVAVGESDLEFGAVSSLSDAEKCIRKFQEEPIDGLLISLPNFGDESSLFEVARRAARGLPILIQAFPDETDLLKVGQRRDAFCGKISLCNNLYQGGIPFNLTTGHVSDPASPAFKKDLGDFLRICRITRRMKSNRLGQIGVRPDAFRTVRYSEKILENNDQTVYQISLERIVTLAKGLDADNPQLKEIKDALLKFRAASGNAGKKNGQDNLDRLARLGGAIKTWIMELSLDAYAIQCWTDLQEVYGVVPCAVMSVLGQMGIPGACEADILGALSMLALQAASDSPPALIDWNNNYDENPDQCVLFHCSNFPPSTFDLTPTLEDHPVLIKALGEDKVFGSLAGHIKPGEITYLRLSTHDAEGTLRGYTGSGRILPDKVQTFGGRGVVEISEMEKLLEFICLNGFEHHAAIGPGNYSGVISSTLEKYLGWPMHHHP